MILTIRTDKPESEIGLYDNGKGLDYCIWQAHRELAETINSKIDELLKLNDAKYADLTGIVVYKGPGSFTGLRIGISVANAIAYAGNIPICGAIGDNWIEIGLNAISDVPIGHYELPEYGTPVHITSPKK